jgi:subtilisin family serine protease
VSRSRLFALLTVTVACALASASAAGPDASNGAQIARSHDPFGSAPVRSLARSVRAPSDPLWSQAWSLRSLRLPDVWPTATGDAATVVAVIDTGVDPAHPDLAGALVSGHDTLSSGVGTADENGHGTAVAGVIAARSDNRTGVTSVCGGCSVMPVKVIAANGIGDSSHIAAGIVWAADHGARVINLSVVLDSPQQSVEDAVRYAHDHGAVVVAAAGNGGGASPTYPAAYAGVIAVAASQEDGALYPWSQRGPWVDVAAPGCSPSTARGGDYTMFCGTSSASAAASGAVALALSAVPTATNADVERLIVQTARPLGGDGGVASGAIDAAALVDALRAEAASAIRLAP